MQMSPLVEYLLTYQRPAGGGNLCRLGVDYTIIFDFPANYTITYDIYPLSGVAYAIMFYHRWSPSIVPLSTAIDVTHKGIILLGGGTAPGEITYEEGQTVWFEISQQNPMRSIYSNVSGLTQLHEALDYYILVDTEEDMAMVRDVVHNYGGKETANLLRDVNTKLGALTLLGPRERI